MRRYFAYLETGAYELCMAHALELPGCFVRAAGRDEALRRLPGEIRAYYAWLHRHGDPVPTDESIHIEIAEETTATGPFNPGDAAALFSPDKQPVTIDDAEIFFHRMAYSRQDLLAPACNLSREVLEWKPNPESFNIQRILRHIGNAEEWYVSRIVATESLPPEWEHDEDLPILVFLEMERRTALEHLRQLDEKERTEVFYPTQWTDHPEEAWTARKVLRRFLEHEREHTAQIQEILDQWVNRGTA